MNSTFAPVARYTDLVTTETGDEVLVYDQNTHHIHHLNQTAAAVWRLCDGRRSIAAIAREASASEESVRLALTKLSAASLLQDEMPVSLRASSQSRRSFMRKAAGAVAIPAIVSVSAPHAAQASTPTFCNDASGNLRTCPNGLDSECSNQIAGCGQCGCPNGTYQNLCVNPGQSPGSYCNP